MKSHPSHSYKREILVQAKNVQELHELECTFIEQSFDNPLCKNNIIDSTFCTPCPECGVNNNNHKNWCSRYKPHKPCPECGAINSHLKTCSHAKHCPECGATNGHFKTCSKYIPHDKIICKECGGHNGKHKHVCSRYQKELTCSECGGISGKHKKGCSHYKRVDINNCKYCGAPPGGYHKKDCPNYVDLGKCPECGYSLQSRRHAKHCSQYKPITKRCPECGGYPGWHKKGCSKYIECPVCHGICGHHKKNCNKNKKHRKE